MSGSLRMTLITASQNQREVTANAALVQLDNALTAAQMQQAILIRAIHATVAGRMVTLPGAARLILLHNNAANTQSVEFIRGTTTPTAAQMVIARLDGSANGLASLLRGTG